MVIDDNTPQVSVSYKDDTALISICYYSLLHVRVETNKSIVLRPYSMVQKHTPTQRPNGATPNAEIVHYKKYRLLAITANSLSKQIL